jgi:hypothetical protein
MHEHSFDLGQLNSEQILLERSDFHVRLANTHGRRSSSSVLINRMYAWRGYKSNTNDDVAHADQVTLQACRGDEVFGTLSVCVDSELGLAADASYRNEIDAYRMIGATVCEFTRLAVDPEHGSKKMLGALFHLACIHVGVLRGATDIFIEVNPRHVQFYQRMLHFRQAGDFKMCRRVGAVAVLLHVELAYVREQIARYGGHRKPGNSLYPYFFSQEEERGLPQRLLRQNWSSRDVTATVARARGLKDQDIRSRAAPQSAIPISMCRGPAP